MVADILSRQDEQGIPMSISRWRIVIGDRQYQIVCSDEEGDAEWEVSTGIVFNSEADFARSWNRLLAACELLKVEVPSTSLRRCCPLLVSVVDPEMLEEFPDLLLLLGGVERGIAWTLLEGVAELNGKRRSLQGEG
jgi:hypothetical protein